MGYVTNTTAEVYVDGYKFNTVTATIETIDYTPTRANYCENCLNYRRYDGSINFCNCTLGGANIYC